MILQFNTGIDVGNGFSKYQGGRFASKVKLGSLSTADVSNNSEVHQVIYEDVEYIVGDESGASFMNENRYFSKYYLIALLTSIALASGTPNSTIKANVVIGVPVDDYNISGDKVAEHFNNIKETKEITVDGHLYRIEIKYVTVFIEGAYPIASQNNNHIITIDVGAGTINVIEWKNQEIVNKFTIRGAFRKLHKDVVEFINAKHGTRLQVKDADKVIGKKEINTPNGKVDITEINEIVDLTISEHASTIRDSFGVDLCDAIEICGGGAEKTYDYWNKYFPKAEKVNESQFANQRVYQAVAKSVYGE